MAMIAQMLDYPTYTTTISPLAVIAGRSPGIQPLFGQVLHAIAYIYVLAQWFFSYGKDERWFEWTALMTLVITHLVAFRTATTNYLVLLPALFLVFRVTEQRWQGVGRVLTLAVLLALGAGLWGLFIVTVTGNIEGPIMYLPVPFLCLFGLWWVRWWALRPPRLMLEEFSRRLG
jgi:O-antigen ligase